MSLWVIPHAVLFFDTPDDLGAVDIAKIGAQLELHPVFPDRANIEFIAPLGTDHLRMRVWERGAGITSACGSGACATAVAAVRRGLTGPSVWITLDGGDLHIHWPAEGPHADHVIMTGAVDYSTRQVQRRFACGAGRVTGDECKSPANRNFWLPD